MSIFGSEINTMSDVYKNYNIAQIRIVEKGLSSKEEDSEYGDVSELSPVLYTSFLMEIISRGRGSNEVYGRIDDLDPDIDHKVAKIISLGRGSSMFYGNVDFVHPLNIDYKVLHLISLGEGSDSQYPSIRDIDPRLPYEKVLEIIKLRIH